MAEIISVSNSFGSQRVTWQESTSSGVIQRSKVIDLPAEAALFKTLVEEAGERYPTVLVLYANELPHLCQGVNPGLIHALHEILESDARVESKLRLIKDLVSLA